MITQYNIVLLILGTFAVDAITFTTFKNYEKICENPDLKPVF